MEKNPACQISCHKNCNTKSGSLDKLAQLGTNPLYKRAKAKKLMSHLTVALANVPNSELTKQYWNSFHCCNTLYQNGNKITSRYCNTRWCVICNRIRIAKLIHGYHEPLMKLGQTYFVTLTVVNCKAEKLRETIELMQSVFKAICEKIKRQRQRGTIAHQIRGIRKIECTYNPRTDEYHPHFHLIVEHEYIAHEIRKEWMERWEGLKPDAQDVKATYGNSQIELFKYFTKIITKIKDENNVVTDFKIDTKSLDVIFTAMKGLRVFQSIGLKRNVSEEVDELVTEIIEGIEEKQGMLQWVDNDWYDTVTGEGITGYKPSKAMEELILKIE